MKFFTALFGNRKENKRKTLSDHRQEALVKQGAEQFKSLLKKGLSVPVVFL